MAEGERAVTKPINRWAIGIWIVAAAYLLTGLIDIYQQEPTEPITLLWVLLRTHAFSLAQLAGLGVLVELVDQIRWDAQNRKSVRE
jgi:hypothetical protein